MKKIFVFLLVAIVAISLSAVSAAENTIDDVVVSNDDSAVVSEVNDIASCSDNATVESETIQDTTDNVKYTSYDQSGVITTSSVNTNDESVVSSGNNSTNTVTNSTFFNYFDNTGVLKDNVTSDLTFEGNFSELGVDVISINKQINLIGNNAVLNNIALSINANNVSVSDFAISLVNTSDVKSAIEIFGTNVNLFNNIISVESAVDENSFAILAENANKLTMNNNNIFYVGKTNGTYINNIIYLIDSNDVNILNNTITAKIPSVPVDYIGPNYDATVMSAGIYAKNVTNLNIDLNNIDIGYNNASGLYDTIYAIYVENTNNAIVNNNNVTLKGHSYAYGINMGGKNFTVASNNIHASSDNNYANGIQIADNSYGIVEDNEFTVESPVVTYAIYSSNWGSKANNITYKGNKVVSNSSFIYGIYVSGNNENLINNELILNGNFTTGVASSAANLTMNGNNIIANGNNMGNKNSIWESISPETTGVRIAYGNATIFNNTIAVNGDVNGTSFAIHAETADNLIINGNNIDFEAKGNGSDITNAIRVIDSNNVNIVNNTIVAKIPSVPVSYDPITWKSTVMSEGIHVSGFTNLTIDSNNILVEYNNASGSYDTIYALDIAGNKANIKNNNITTKGHTYTYGINIVGEDMTIDSNTINSISDNNYANAIQIGKDSTGIINHNKVFVDSPVVAYGIYSSDWSNRTNNVTYKYNVVTGKSAYVYGIYVSGHNESLLSNDISLTGNFTTGVASSADNLAMNGTIIVAAGNNIGNASKCGDSIIAETTGIKIVRGNASITESSVQTTGDYAVNTTGAGSITYNYLISNVGLGDSAVSANNQTIVENNSPKAYFNVPDIVKMYGTDDKLQAFIGDSKYNPIANATVVFNINGKNYTRTTNASGVASMNINLDPGVYKVVTTYNNLTTNSVVNVTSSIIGDNIIKIFQNGTQFFATFYGKDGKTLANNTNVSFNINGVFYTRQTNENGTARLNINLNPGEYILTAINPVNNETKGFNISVLSNIETQNLVKYYRNGTQFVVKVLNKDGTLANGTNITFNINGVFYTRDVVNGTAQLSINLYPSEYQITTIYEGLSVGNNVTVKPTLITDDLSMSFQDGSKFNATVLDGQGNPLANQTVLFNVNGVFYNRTSGNDGVASLNINLNKGNYVITSMWNEYQIGNKITIA